MKQQAFAVTAVLLLYLATPVLSADWPEFRGPTGQGIVPKGELPTTWGKDKNIAWKQAIPGKGWSSPIVVGGRVYLTTAVSVKDADELSLEALCLDAGTGAILWEKEVFRQDGKNSPPIHTKNSHASPTPLIRGDRLFVHFGHQGTACLNLKREIVWKNTSLRFIPIHGNGGSPILVDDLLVFSSDGREDRFVTALNAADGKVRWKTNRTLEADRCFSFSTPLLIEVRGQKQLISPGSGGVTAYDPSNGKEIWWVRYNGYSVIPRPVYGHGLVFVCTGYDRPSLLAIRPDGQGDVTTTHVAWKTAKAVAHTPSLLLVGEELYMMSDFGIASCLDARTGEVHWQQRIGGNFSASPLCADGKLYFLSEEGDTTVVLAGKRFTLAAKNAMGERSLASPAAADGALFLRTDKHLFRIGER
jgi:outer membrane protein assembly factor BamB